MTISSLSWTIDGLSPRTFNVISDILGLVVLTLTIYLVQRMYPQLVWNSIHQGHPVPVEGLLGPPSLREILRWFPRRLNTDHPQLHLLPSSTLLVLLPALLVITHLAHTLSDVFVQFVAVPVNDNHDITRAFFLSGAPSGTVPTHALLGDTKPRTTTLPPVAQTRVVHQADAIAQGAHRRFSLVPSEKEFLVLTRDYLVGNLLEHLHADLQQQATNNHTALDPSMVARRRLPASPELLGVQCYLPQQQQQDKTKDYWYQQWSTYLGSRANSLMYQWDIQYNALETVTMTQQDDADDGSSTIRTIEQFVSIPDCDFDGTPVTTNDSRIMNIDPNNDHLPLVDTADPNWSIASWDSYRFGPAFYNVHTWDPFGMRDLQDDLRWFLEFDSDETELSFLRSESWHTGRRTRNGIVLAMGLQSPTETLVLGRADGDPYLLLPMGVEFAVDYSVLSGPVQSGGTQYYVLSSWSRNCPRPAEDESDGSLVVDTYPVEESSNDNDNDDNISGCIVDVWIQANDVLPQDRMDTATRDDPAPRLVPIRMDVTLIRNLVVDPAMLATYAGIATRNKGMNYFSNNDDDNDDDDDETLHVGVAMNSIAAAFLLTREVIPGSWGVEEVRAQVSPGYIVLMVLPLVLVGILVLSTVDATAKANGDQPNPVPRTLWQVMLLAREQSPLIMPLLSKADEEDDREQKPEQNSATIQPHDVKFGIPRDALTADAQAMPRLALNTDFELKRQKPKDVSI